MILQATFISIFFVESVAGYGGADDSVYFFMRIVVGLAFWGSIGAIGYQCFDCQGSACLLVTFCGIFGICCAFMMDTRTQVAQREQARLGAIVRPPPVILQQPTSRAEMPLMRAPHSDYEQNYSASSAAVPSMRLPEYKEATAPIDEAPPAYDSVVESQAVKNKH